MNFSTVMLKQTYDRAKSLWRANTPAGRDITRKRVEADEILNELGRRSTATFNGTVLVDATFDNPNYWLRFSLLRAALGLADADEVGLLGQYRRKECGGTLRRLGIDTVECFPDIAIPVADVQRQVTALLAKTKLAEDILTWQLPEGIDPAIVYDGILKRQRLAMVDIGRTDFPWLVHEAIASIERGRRLLDSRQFDLLVVSHPFNYTLGTLAWQALGRGIEAVMPFGLFGLLRFTRFREPGDLARFYDRPVRAEIDGLPPVKASALAAVGRCYMQGRMQGAAGDLGSQFAFQRNNAGVNRTTMCEKFGWDPVKPIVGVYASNWYDWPHQLGMTQFRDFLDWTEATYEAARANDAVNFLFKAHPAEEWFGGISLAEVFEKFGTAPHIALAEKSWNNAQVMQSIDALITYHGTAGIEFAVKGKPVLVPDRGKYDDCGFVLVAESRRDYLDMIKRDWWGDIDLIDTQRRAEIFAGWWFCMPEWQGRFLLDEDATQDALYSGIPSLVGDNSDVIDRELDELRSWWQSGHLYYHTTKMAKAGKYVLSNLKSPKGMTATNLETPSP